MPGARARLIAVAQGDMDWCALEASDAIVFGSPTYNGSLSAKAADQDVKFIATKGLQLGA